jgi:hypothetical protein
MAQSMDSDEHFRAAHPVNISFIFSERHPPTPPLAYSLAYDAITSCVINELRSIPQVATLINWISGN